MSNPLDGAKIRFLLSGRLGGGYDCDWTSLMRRSFDCCATQLRLRFDCRSRSNRRRMGVERSATLRRIVVVTEVISGCRDGPSKNLQCERRGGGWERSQNAALWPFVVTLRASCGAVYCNRSCLWVWVWVSGWMCVCVCMCVFVCGCACYHDNSKLRASIPTKLGLWVKVVTISS